MTLKLGEIDNEIQNAVFLARFFHGRILCVPWQALSRNQTSFAGGIHQNPSMIFPPKNRWLAQEIWLVVTGTWLDYDFPYIYIGNFIIPTDKLSMIFQGGRSTTETEIDMVQRSSPVIL